MKKFNYNFSREIISGNYEGDGKVYFENGAVFLDGDGQFCPFAQAKLLVVLYIGQYDDLRNAIKSKLMDRDGYGVCDPLTRGVYAIVEGGCIRLTAVEPYFDFYTVERNLNDNCMTKAVDDFFANEWLPSFEEIFGELE